MKLDFHDDIIIHNDSNLKFLLEKREPERDSVTYSAHIKIPVFFEIAGYAVCRLHVMGILTKFMRDTIITKIDDLINNLNKIKEELRK